MEIAPKCFGMTRSIETRAHLFWQCKLNAFSQKKKGSLLAVKKLQSTTFTALKWMMIFYHWFSECEDFFGVANVNNFLQAGSFIFNKISRLFSV